MLPCSNMFEDVCTRYLCNKQHFLVIHTKALKSSKYLRHQGQLFTTLYINVSLKLFFTPQVRLWSVCRKCPKIDYNWNGNNYYWWMLTCDKNHMHERYLLMSFCICTKSNDFHILLRVLLFLIEITIFHENRCIMRNIFCRTYLRCILTW